MDYIILPLYSHKNNEKTCFPKSSLNQSNARGRERNLHEIYIPIPKEVREKTLKFLPSESFKLYSHNLKRIFNVSTCQQDDKALMSNPNADLGEWLFKELGIEKTSPNDVVSYEELAKTGYDSIKIEIIDEKYYISLMPVGSYENFIKKKPS